MKQIPGLRSLVAAFGVIFIASCDEGVLVSNKAPDTHLAIDTIALQGENRLNSVVRLSWYGTDVDGVIDHYEVSLDGQNWKSTERQDSTFSFVIPAGQDTSDISLSVRSLDDDGAVDPSPAHLIIPLQNAPPVVAIDPEGQTLGTTLGVATYKWRATDPDGNNTVVYAEAKFNNGTWFPLDIHQPIVSFVLEAGTTTNATAKVFNGIALLPETLSIDGIQISANNVLYIRAKDLANRWSAIDTAEPVVFERPTAPLLVISGSPVSVNTIYQTALAGLTVAYDFINMNTVAGLPAYWNPTFRLLASQYDRIFVYSASTGVLDPSTGQTSTLLGLMGPSLQQFTQTGGKLLVSTSFGPTTDLTPYIGTYPMEGIVTSIGQVRLVPDSALVPAVSGTYPSLHPENIVIGLTPLVAAADAQPFYRAQLTKLNGWQGDNLVGVRRFYQGNPAHPGQVFFSVELYKINQSASALQSLLSKILVDDFGW